MIPPPPRSADYPCTTLFGSNQGERRIERPLAGDVGPDAQPVRRQVGIGSPTLQVRSGGTAGGYGRLGSGKQQEIPAGQLHFRAEEIVVCRQNESRHVSDSAA